MLQFQVKLQDKSKYLYNAHCSRKIVSCIIHNMFNNNLSCINSRSVLGVCCNVQCWPCFHPLYISLIQIISHTKEDHSIIRGLPTICTEERGGTTALLTTDIICWVESVQICSEAGEGGSYQWHSSGVISCITWHQVQPALLHSSGNISLTHNIPS